MSHHLTHALWAFPLYFQLHARSGPNGSATPMPPVCFIETLHVDVMTAKQDSWRGSLCSVTTSFHMLGVAASCVNWPQFAHSTALIAEAILTVLWNERLMRYQTCHLRPIEGSAMAVGSSEDVDEHTAEDNCLLHPCLT